MSQVVETGVSRADPCVPLPKSKVEPGSQLLFIHVQGLLTQGRYARKSSCFTQPHDVPDAGLEWFTGAGHCIAVLGCQFLFRKQPRFWTNCSMDWKRLPETNTLLNMLVLAGNLLSSDSHQPLAGNLSFCSEPASPFSHQCCPLNLCMWLRPLQSSQQVCEACLQAAIPCPGPALGFFGKFSSALACVTLSYRVILSAHSHLRHSIFRFRLSRQ